MNNAITERIWHARQQDNTPRQNALKSGLRQVSANYVALLCRYLEVNHTPAISPEITRTWVEHAGIQPTSLTDPNTHIGEDAYEYFINTALKATDEPHLGLHFGRRLNISTHGFLGYAVMSCPSLTKAADLASQYIQIRNQLLIISHETADDQLTITFAPQSKHQDINRFEIEASLSSVETIWYELFGTHEGIHKIILAESLKAHAETYRSCFTCPLEFTGTTSCIQLKLGETSLLSRITDTTLSDVAEKQCKQVLERLNEQETSPLITQIRQALLKTPGRFPSQQHIADQLGMSARTMNRQLKQQGAGFKHILDDIRQSLAKDCLTQTDWNNEEIAHVLGYSDAANFARAFKRWRNVTPYQFRQNQRT